MIGCLSGFIYDLYITNAVGGGIGGEDKNARGAVLVNKKMSEMSEDELVMSENERIKIHRVFRVGHLEEKDSPTRALFS